MTNRRSFLAAIATLLSCGRRKSAEPRAVFSFDLITPSVEVVVQQMRKSKDGVLLVLNTFAPDLGRAKR